MLTQPVQATRNFSTEAHARQTRAGIIPVGSRSFFVHPLLKTVPHQNIVLDNQCICLVLLPIVRSSRR